MPPRNKYPFIVAAGLYLRRRRNPLLGHKFEYYAGVLRPAATHFGSQAIHGVVRKPPVDEFEKRPISCFTWRSATIARVVGARRPFCRLIPRPTPAMTSVSLRLWCRFRTFPPSKTTIASLHGSRGAAIAESCRPISRPPTLIVRKRDGAGSWLVPMSLILDGFEPRLWLGRARHGSGM